jgi:HAD superfamily hydrolase (TIGR01509 family)
MAAPVSYKDRAIPSRGHPPSPPGAASGRRGGESPPLELLVVTDLPAAVLWDMDGTIIDTEPYWMDAETVMVSSYGGVWTHEDGLTLIGSGLHHSARVLQARGVPLSEDEIIEQLTTTVLDRIRAHGLPWRPGARELLEELGREGVPAALVTMSIRRLALAVVDAMGFEAFAHVVAGDDVEHSKPHPAAYLRAAELLGVDPARCVAIEDSPPGVASAVASGAATIGVPLNAELFEDSGYTIWPTLEGRTVADLGTLLAAVTAAGKKTP